jgi:hypothetical protein
VAKAVGVRESRDNVSMTWEKKKMFKRVYFRKLKFFPQQQSSNHMFLWYQKCEFSPVKGARNGRNHDWEVQMPHYTFVPSLIL